MQNFLYAAVALQMIALISYAIYSHPDKQEFQDWVKRVCN